MEHIQYKRKPFHPETPEGKRNDFTAVTRNYNQLEETGHNQLLQESSPIQWQNGPFISHEPQHEYI